MRSRTRLRGALLARTLARVLVGDLFGPHAVREDATLRLIAGLAETLAAHALSEAEFFEGTTLVWQCIARYVQVGRGGTQMRSVAPWW